MISRARNAPVGDARLLLRDTSMRSVAILAPAGRDAQVTTDVLARAGLHSMICTRVEEICDAVHEGVGALVITEEALSLSATECLVESLARQPKWSDIPLVVLTGSSALSQGASPRLARLMARANVTLLERPVRVATLVSSLASALRGRQRQFDLRDQLEAMHAGERTLRENEHRLRLAREEAEAANRSKAEFLAVMSHELRTPLNAIGGYADLLALGIRGPVTAEQREDLMRIRRSQQHLLGLINEVLNYARIEAGSVLYELTDVAVDSIVAFVRLLVAPQASAKGLTLRHDEGAMAGLVAHADEEKTRQILLNLLSNAIKFTPRGGRIDLEGEYRGAMVALHVRDTGIGIAESQLGNVFEPFVQVNTSLTRTQEGTGLGLAISRDLARGMGGDLTATSTVGRGSTFTLTLPRGAAGAV